MPAVPIFDANLRALMAAIDKSTARIEFCPRRYGAGSQRAVPRLMGYSLAKVKGRHHTLFVPAAERDGEEYPRVLGGAAAGRSPNTRVQTHCAGRPSRLDQATYNPVRDRAGRVARIVKFATDITAQVLRNIDHDGQLNALHRSQAVIEFGLDGTILTANQNFLDAVGYSLDEVKGRQSQLVRRGAANGRAPLTASSGRGSRGGNSPRASTGASPRAVAKYGSRHLQPDP